MTNDDGGDDDDGIREFVSGDGIRPAIRLFFLLPINLFYYEVTCDEIEMCKNSKKTIRLSLGILFSPRLTSS